MCEGGSGVAEGERSRMRTGSRIDNDAVPKVNSSN